MTERRVTHLDVEQREARGRLARERMPVSSHSGWRPAAGRPDPVGLPEEQSLTREPDLPPVRHGRMMVSPFTLYRGAAKIMAADLPGTPVAGLGAQLSGDAHLPDFGAFASPERRLVFDLNNFDETLPGPFEYDVKRMAASFAVAARNNGFARADARSGDPIAEYLGPADGFGKSITDFSERYADQNEQDYQNFIKAVRSGRLEAVEGA